MNRTKFFKKRMSALLLALILLVSTIPAALATDAQTESLSAQSTFDASNDTITYEVKPGSVVNFDGTDFRNVLQSQYHGFPLNYVSFNATSNYNATDGYIYYNYGGFDEIAFSRSDLNYNLFYYAQSSYGSYSINRLSFVAGSNFSGSFSMEFRAYYDEYTYVDGTLIIRARSSTSSKSISYEVAPGKSVSFDRNDFRKVFENEYGNYSLNYVAFSVPSDYNAVDGYIYYDYGGFNEIAFSRGELNNYWFYYSSASYGEYPINGLSFVAGRNFSGSFSVAFRAYYDNSTYVDGTLTIRSSSSSGGSSISGSTVTYEVSPGKNLTFDRSDFNSVFQRQYGDLSMRYLTFSVSNDYNAVDGYVYYDYGGFDEIAFSKGDLNNYTFYYSGFSYGDYPINSLSFVAGRNFSGSFSMAFRAYYDNSTYVDGTLVIRATGSSSSVSGSTVTYEVKANEEINFSRADFNNVFQREYPGDSIRYVAFSATSSYDSADGYIYYDYGRSDQIAFTSSSIDDYYFYYSDVSYGEYPINNLSFVAGRNFNSTVRLSFRAYSSSGRYVDGTLVISPSGASSSASITYEVNPGNAVSFDRADFNKVFQNEYGSDSIRYVIFSAPSDYTSTDGAIYYNYGGFDECSFSRNSIEDYYFYYSDRTFGDYPLSGLSFVAGQNFKGSVTLSFRAYYSDSRYVDGTVRIQSTGSAGSTSRGDILYSTTYGTPVQINPNDIARYLSRSYPNSILQYVRLEGVPSTGTLYYNYYGASKYGVSKLALTSSNYASQDFYFSPSSTSQYSLTELTYVPNGVNYCAAIPFTAYGSGSCTVRGTILISVNFNATLEVYGATPKGSSVNFPSVAIYTAVASSTSTALSSIQLLSLPTSAQGAVYVGNTMTKANTSTKYTYASGSQSISQLRFVPANGFAGSVEIPYVAYSSTGSAITTGKFCLGIVSSVHQFKDLTPSTWCYKYVTELSDADIIDGYTDGSFRPDNTVTYGQALKLIMLASGYPVQPQTGKHVFSGYLSRAQQDGLISGNVNLDAPITRLAVAQIAAKAMKLNTSNLSSVKPFTDTSDPYVQALNAAGIVEGYFSNGTSTYKPNNTLTRGQISAIVWRMERSR